MVENWDLFKESFVFPHNVKIGGGKMKWFDNEREFLEFLIMNQEASFVWAGHLQLQITAKYYQTKVHVLSVDSKGKGVVFTFLPDGRLQHKSLLPRLRSDGKVMDIMNFSQISQSLNIGPLLLLNFVFFMKLIETQPLNLMLS